MKHFNKKLKNALFISIIMLIAFVGFSESGIIFSEEDTSIIKVSSTQRDLEPSIYAAYIASNIKNNNVTTTVPATTVPTTTKAETTTTTEVTNNVENPISLIPKDAYKLEFEGKSLSEVGSTLNKTFKGALKDQGEYFAYLAMDKGMDPYLLAAISIHETGNGTSNAAVNKHNFGGVMCSGKLCVYESFSVGLSKYVDVVYRNYFSKGLTTPEAMAKKYAASTSWASKVTNWYNTIKNK